ncbi:MAG: hypothetical protein WCA59_09665 [Candidatus Binataceae bacterium]
MEIVGPSAGDLFGVSAATVKKLEATALMLGQMTDLVRSLTVAPLTQSQRVMVVAAFKSFSALDPLIEALDGALARLRTFAADIEDSNRGGTNGR